MKFTNQKHEITKIDKDALQIIERVARTCYKSEDRITNDSAKKLVKKLQKSEHFAMFEFADITVKFITNRFMTHELVRHRLCSFAQESTRYVRYSGEMEFIIPYWYYNVSHHAQAIFRQQCLDCEQSYKSLLAEGLPPQGARHVLGDAIKAEINVKTNIREWRHILKLRTSKAADPQMRRLMVPLLNELKSLLPIVFDDIEVEK